MPEVTDWGKLVAALGSRYRLACGTERELQDAIEDVLKQEGIAYEREVELGPTDRPDFMVGGGAVEVKTQGSMTDVARQLLRYAKHQAVDRLMLVTTRSGHVHIHRALLGKPLVILYVSSL